MKRLILIFCLLGIGKCSLSQWTVSGTDIYNSNAGKVGIGTSSPAYKLDVAGDARIFGTVVTGSNSPLSNSGIIYTSSGMNNFFGVDGEWSTKYFGLKTNGSFITMGGNVGIGVINPQYKLDVTGVISAGDGSNGGTYRIEGKGGFSYPWSIRTSTLEGLDFASDNGIGRIAFLDNGNVGIGTTTPAEKLSVNGTIRSKEVKVETANWPDYVFEEGYKVEKLEELESYIKANKHLPGIPSAKEVEKEGISLGEMNAKLLEKIEELTIYVIEQNKILTGQQKQIDELKNKRGRNK